MLEKAAYCVQQRRNYPTRHHGCITTLGLRVLAGYHTGMPRLYIILEIDNQRKIIPGTS